MRVTMQLITVLRRYFTKQDCIVITFAVFAILLASTIFGVTALLF